MPVSQDEKFELNVLDEESGERYTGEFEVRARLSQSLKMKRSRLIREFLGEFSKDATEDDQLRAVVLADCSTFLSKAPNWWIQSDNGLNLSSDEVVFSVWNKIMEIQKKRHKAQKEDAAEDVKALKNATAKGDSLKDDDE